MTTHDTFLFKVMDPFKTRITYHLRSVPVQTSAFAYSICLRFLIVVKNGMRQTLGGNRSRFITTFSNTVVTFSILLFVLFVYCLEKCLVFGLNWVCVTVCSRRSCVRRASIVLTKARVNHGVVCTRTT